MVTILRVENQLQAKACTGHTMKEDLSYNSAKSQHPRQSLSIHRPRVIQCTRYMLTLAMFLTYIMLTSLEYSDDVALSELLLLLILGTINHDDEFFTSWHKHCPITASLHTWSI